MSHVAQTRELLFALPCSARMMAEWWDVPTISVSAALNGLLRTRQAVSLTPRHRGVPGVYTLTPKGRAKVLDQVRTCEICGKAPTVGVRVFLTSDPVTTRVVCAQHATPTTQGNL